MSFFQKIKNSKVKQVLSGTWYQREGTRHEEMVEDEYGGNITYSCMKMEEYDLLELF
jgi:hypothetical protein